MAVTPLTREQLLGLPPAVDVETAGKALGIGRTLAHQLARRGEFPIPVLRLGVMYRVPTAPRLDLLGVTRDDDRPQRTTDPIEAPSPQVTGAAGHDWSHEKRTA